MVKIIQSECRKLKNTLFIYLVVAIALITAVSLPFYFLIKPNKIDACLEICAVMPFVVAIFTNLVVDQERAANNFENMITHRYSGMIMLVKLSLVDIIFMVPSIGVWVVVGISQNTITTCLSLGITTWLLGVLLNHLHMLVSLISRQSVGYILATVEVMFIIFASHKCTANMYWFPAVLPINQIVHVGHNNMLVSLTYAAVFLFAIAVLIQNKRFKREK